MPSVALILTVLGRLEPMARRTDRISRSASASDKKSRFVSIPSDPTERITISDALEASPLILSTSTGIVCLPELVFGGDAEEGVEGAGVAEFAEGAVDLVGEGPVRPLPAPKG